jgi:tetratricopeptide (TPR) repeat protein
MAADNPRIDDLRRRVQKDPASIAFAQLAEEYRRAAQYEDAVDVCRSGLTLHPTYLSARVTLGRALVELGDLDAALAELEAVLASAPENLAAIRGIADIHQQRGNLADALKYSKRALALARFDPELEQAVEDLSRRIAPTSRVESADFLSLGEMQREIQAIAPAAVMPALAAGPSIIPSMASLDDRADNDGISEPDGRARKTVAALEQWLEAIHGARSELRS